MLRALPLAPPPSFAVSSTGGGGGHLFAVFGLGAVYLYVYTVGVLCPSGVLILRLLVGFKASHLRECFEVGWYVCY